jgi:hypothetical protein
LRLHIRDTLFEGEIMARIGMIVVALLASSVASFAADMIFTPALPCRMIAETVSLRGVALLSTGRDMFDRYVSDQSRCERDEQITPAWVRSADKAQCFVGYTCEHYFE